MEGKINDKKSVHMSDVFFFEVLFSLLQSLRFFLTHSVLRIIVPEKNSIKVMQCFMTYSNGNLLPHMSACEMSRCLGQVRSGRSKGEA
jgi:hypothetical protein